MARHKTAFAGLSQTTLLETWSGSRIHTSISRLHDRSEAIRSCASISQHLHKPQLSRIHPVSVSNRTWLHRGQWMNWPYVQRIVQRTWRSRPLASWICSCSSFSFLEIHVEAGRLFVWSLGHSRKTIMPRTLLDTSDRPARRSRRRQEVSAMCSCWVGVQRLTYHQDHGGE